MHKDIVKITVRGKMDNKEEVISDAVHGINGVNQWSVSPTHMANQFEVEMWKGTGLDHVKSEEKLVRELMEDETVGEVIVDNVIRGT